MKSTSQAFLLAAAALFAASPLLLAQNEGQGQGQAIVTVLPKQNGVPTAPDVSSQSLQIQVNGKAGQVTNWQALRGPQAGVELVVLIDDGARASLGREMDEIAHFIQSLPPNVRVSIAYMENGRAALAAPFTSDHARVLQSLHLPLGVPGQSASPYFCLSDLAKHWPSQDRRARRQVIMITDGVDYYNLRYDPDDPYVQAAIQDSVRAGLTVYSIYWRNAGRVDNTRYENNAGQNLLAEVTQATGGNSYWIGIGNPVTLQPYFEDFSRRLNNQYELSFSAPLKGKPEVQELKLKTKNVDGKVDAPQKVFVAPAGVAAN